MADRKQKKAFLFFLISVLFIALVGYETGDFNKLFDGPIASTQETYATNIPANDNSINLSDKATHHILYGNETGGGHKYGMNKPCKSEFPKNWNDEDITSRVKNIAANDNTHWKKESNGYYSSEEMVDGINIRVIIGRKQKNIITAYPTNTKRNPCPHYND